MTFPPLPSGGGLIRDRDRIWLEHTSLNPREIRNAWTDWTPSYTNLTEGNGTVVARYAQMGNLVVLHFRFVLGGTSAISTNPAISLPVTASSDYTDDQNVVGWCRMKEDGGDPYHGITKINNSQANLLFREYNVSGSNIIEAGITSTSPFTWGTSDSLETTSIYEAA